MHPRRQLRARSAYMHGVDRPARACLDGGDALWGCGQCPSGSPSVGRRRVRALRDVLRSLVAEVLPGRSPHGVLPGAPVGAPFQGGGHFSGSALGRSGDTERKVPGAARQDSLPFVAPSACGGSLRFRQARGRVAAHAGGFTSLPCIASRRAPDGECGALRTMEP